MDRLVWKAGGLHWGCFTWFYVVRSIIVVVVVWLTPAPEGDHQKRYGCSLKADGLITVGAWVWLVNSESGLGQGWRWWLVGMPDNARRDLSCAGRCRSTSRERY